VCIDIPAALSLGFATPRLLRIEFAPAELLRARRLVEDEDADMDLVSFSSPSLVLLLAGDGKDEDDRDDVGLERREDGSCGRRTQHSNYSAHTNLLQRQALDRIHGKQEGWRKDFKKIKNLDLGMGMGT
jgi:hypothetical protein